MLTAHERMKFIQEGQGPKGDNPSVKDWNKWELETSIHHCMDENGGLSLEEMAQVIADGIGDSTEVAMLAGNLQRYIAEGDDDDRNDDHD